MRHLPPLSSVRVFEAAARHENFTLAAAELGMSQAAVSYQVRLLEERLGVPLFVRSKRRVTLSEAGRRLAPVVSDAFDRLSEGFSGLVDEDESVLAISTAQTFASNWLAPRLGGFQIARPELAVRLLTSNAMIDFAREDVDVAVRMGSGPWPGLRQHFLFCLHATPVCTPGVPRPSPDRAALGPASDPAPQPAGRVVEAMAPGGRHRPAGRGPPAGHPPRFAGAGGQCGPCRAGHRHAHAALLAERSGGGPARPAVRAGRRDGPGLVARLPRAQARPGQDPAFRDWLLAEIAVDAPAGPAEAFTPPEWAGAG
jgi:DNA-binding transcriptional LysR family regulator